MGLANKRALGVSEGAEHESGFKNFPYVRFSIKRGKNSVFGYF